MKILHVNSALSGGGLEQYLVQLFDQLDAIGFHNALLYGEGSDSPDPMNRVKTYYIEDIARVRCRDLTNKLARAQRILDHEAPDLVFIHQVLNPALMDLLTQRKPSIRFVHGFKLVCPDGRKTLKAQGRLCPFPLSYLCQARAYRHRCMPRNPFTGMPLIRGCKRITAIHQSRSHMIVSSKFMKDLLLYNGFDENRVSVIPLFTRLPVSRDVAPDQDPMILALGRLTPEKGMDFLLRAFSRLAGTVKLVILGDGPALGSLKHLSETLGISDRVSFPGWVPHADLGSFYRGCSMVVLPSLSPESFGLVGIEAMSYRKPVVAFDLGGVSEWLEDGRTGFAVPPRNVNELAAKISLLLENPGLARRLGMEGRMQVERRFGPEDHLRRLLPLFEKVVEKDR